MVRPRAPLVPASTFAIRHTFRARSAATACGVATRAPRPITKARRFMGGEMLAPDKALSKSRACARRATLRPRDEIMELAPLVPLKSLHRSLSSTPGAHPAAEQHVARRPPLQRQEAASDETATVQCAELFHWN